MLDYQGSGFPSVVLLFFQLGYIHEKLPRLENADTVVIANVAGNTIDEYIQVVQRIENHPRVNGFEVNVSCPNVKKGGLAFGTEPEMTAEVVQKIRKVTKKTLIIKLTPNVTDIASIARAAEDAGADALSCINTILGMAIDIRTRKPLLSRIVGGLSGPAVKPVAIARVYQVSQAVKIPVIGLGGIMTWEDAVEFLLAGAAAVQLGTLNFVNPSAAIEIIENIEKYCLQNQISEVRALTGAMQTCAL